MKTTILVTTSSHLEFDRYKVRELTQEAASSQLLYEVQQKKHLDELPGKTKGNGESSISPPEQCNLLSGKKLRKQILVLFYKTTSYLKELSYITL